jgi:flagellar biosynthesis/type III secretory pathway protein FliH
MEIKRIVNNGYQTFKLTEEDLEQAAREYLQKTNQSEYDKGYNDGFADGVEDKNE